MVADRPECREWEVFFMHELEGGRIHLQARNGRYVCAVGGGGRELVADREAPQAWETFLRVPDGGKVALRTHTGHIVCAEGGGGGEVLANRTEVKEWEKFTLVWLQL